MIKLEWIGTVACLLTIGLGTIGYRTQESVEQEKPAVGSASDETITITFGPSGIDIEEFLKNYAAASGRNLVYNPKQLQNRIVKGVGEFRFQRSQTDFTYQRILLANDLCVATMSDGKSEISMIEDVKTSQFMKQNARFVGVDDLPTALSRPAETVLTVIALEALSVDQAQRALANIVQDQRIGFVVPNEDANALLICNFPNTVLGMVTAVRALDKAASTEAARAARAAREDAKKRQSSEGSSEKK